MPKIYRIMKMEENKPKIGNHRTCLGVRVPGDGGKHDIAPDEHGNVQPGRGGMSVSSSFRDLLISFSAQPTMIPRRLRDIGTTVGGVRRSLAAGAVGSNQEYVWSMGAGEFSDGDLAKALVLRVDLADAKHDFVEPAEEMPLASYRNALADTRDDWSIDEEP